jgi:ABC-2 type transport system permease protein
MPRPDQLGALLIAFTAASLGFLGLGMMIAMLADTVPAVQALGQCIFLPMLMIGGVALPVESLPIWAQHLSAFFPGRYAVDALSTAISGQSLNDARFDLVALVLIGVGGAGGASLMARWDKRQRLSRRDAALGLVLALGVWGAVGAMAEARGEAVHVAAAEDAANEAIDFQPPAGGPSSWQAVAQADINGIAFDRLPPDNGVVAPIADAAETPSPAMIASLARIETGLAAWPASRAADPVQRVRNELYVAAVPDLLRMEGIERFVPNLVLAQLQRDVPAEDLPKLLYWVAMHPMDGDDSAIHSLNGLGLPDPGNQSRQVRQRVMLYAFKFLGRLTGHDMPANNAIDH